MIDQYISKPHVKKRMLSSPLGVVFESYVLYLHQKGYQQNTIQTYCQALEHFGHWVLKKSLLLKEINELSINVFINKHIAKCQCQMLCSRDTKMIRAALKQLLNLLFSQNILIPANDVKEDFMNKFINDYDNYLIRVCGISDNTRIYRKRYIYAFLKTENLNSFLKISKTEVSPQEYHLGIANHFI